MAVNVCNFLYRKEVQQELRFLLHVKFFDIFVIWFYFQISFKKILFFFFVDKESISIYRKNVILDRMCGLNNSV